MVGEVKRNEIYTLYGESCNTPIKLGTNDPELIKIMRGLYPKRILPNFVVKSPIEGIKVYLSYFINLNLSRATEKINEEEGIIRCYVRAPSYSPGEVSFQFLKILERVWENNNKYCTESSSVGKDKEAILFVGSSGSGKTLLALEMNKRGYEFLSNENTVIDSNYIYGGTTTVNLKEFVADLFPEVISKAKEVYAVSNVKRYLVEFPQPNYPRKIAYIFLIRASPYTEKYEEREVSPEELGFVLYEFPTKLIRGVLSPLGRYRNLGKSLDTLELSEKRLKMFFNLNIPSYYLFGNYKRISDKISKLF
jgi:hypothetical protein